MSGHKNTACARCGKDGHWARNCTVPRPPCFKCGDANHWARDCPQTSDFSSNIQAKLDAMQERINESDKRFEKKLYEKYCKEKKEYDEDSYDEGPWDSGFGSFEKYRAQAIGGKVWEDYQHSVDKTNKEQRKRLLQTEIEGYKQKIKKIQEEIDNLNL